MRIWLFSFALLFGIVEFYQWLKTLSLPLPVYVACGVALAIASNSEKWATKPSSATASVPQSATPVNPTPQIEAQTEVPISLPPPSISYKLEPPAWKESRS